MSRNSSFIFVNNQHSSVFIDRLQCQREAGLFCDVILHVGSHTYAAHKNLLAAVSLYFESMFLKEYKSSENIVHITIHTVSVSPSAFYAVLDYMYLGHISFETISMEDVLMLANEFCLDSLKNYCHAFLDHQQSRDYSLHVAITVDPELETNSTSEITNAVESCQSLLIVSEIKSENENSELEYMNNLKVKQKGKCLNSIRSHKTRIEIEENLPFGSMMSVEYKENKSIVTMIAVKCTEAESLVTSLQTVNQNGRTKCVDTNIVEGGCKILQEASLEAPTDKIIKLLRIKNKNEKVTGSRRGKFLSRSSDKRSRVVDITGEMCKPDLIFDKDSIALDTQQNYQSFKSETNEKLPHSINSKRRRGRPKKKSEEAASLEMVVNYKEAQSYDKPRQVNNQIGMKKGGKRKILAGKHIVLPEFTHKTVEPFQLKLGSKRKTVASSSCRERENAEGGKFDGDIVQDLILEEAESSGENSDDDWSKDTQLYFKVCKSKKKKVPTATLR